MSYWVPSDKGGGVRMHLRCRRVSGQKLLRHTNMIKLWREHASNVTLSPHSGLCGSSLLYLFSLPCCIPKQSNKMTDYSSSPPSVFFIDRLILPAKVSTD